LFLPRIIPVLLLKGKGLVKTLKFKDPRYIGDPINAVKIFNDLKADELIFLDITASKENRTISADLVKNIGDEAFMPFGVGGGISSLEKIEELFKSGAEKVVFNTNAFLNISLIEEAARIFGSQSIVVSIDVKKSIYGKYQCYIKGGTENTNYNPVDFTRVVQEHGAGEIIINSIERDGTMLGYDIKLIKIISDNVNIPVVACGGAGSLKHLKEAYYDGKAHALSAGSMFVFHGPRKAVLINYPSKKELFDYFKNK